jgi:hypothetical protein
MLKAALGICPYIAAGHDLMTVWMQAWTCDRHKMFTKFYTYVSFYYKIFLNCRIKINEMCRTCSSQRQYWKLAHNFEGEYSLDDLDVDGKIILNRS